MPKPTTTVSLEGVASRLGQVWPGLSKVALFGSRRFATGSPRSDLDLLLYFDGPLPAEEEVVEAVRAISVFIDAFLVEGDLAHSAINGSQIGRSGSDIGDRVDAVTIWTRGEGFVGQQFEVQTILRDFSPIYTVGALHGSSSARGAPLDYLVVTALNDEFAAMERALEPHILDRDLGLGMKGRQLMATFPRQHPKDAERLVLCQSDRMGNIASALTTAEALTRYSPRLAVLTGIAGGVRDSTAIGDLVIADRIFDYEAAKLAPFRWKHHGLKLETAFGPRQRTMSWADRDRALSEVVPPGGPGKPRLREAGYASGEKVVTSRFFGRRLLRFDRKIGIIEMESLGVADACRREGLDVFVIKAVTDLADMRKSDDHRDYCCDLAARFLVRLIQDQVLLGT